ncbi:hypothetical protein EGW08_010422 [Elysia chlorotica]|uniref:Lengsin n=1 Tax=Elysia chlorotica TaxID=188477 RepID=A0A433TJS1_ELYCH|nr:hypothetical protein EGW08_010422 [Elysia chlorotica]
MLFCLHQYYSEHFLFCFALKLLFFVVAIKEENMRRQSRREKAQVAVQALVENPYVPEFLELRVYDVHGYSKGRLVATCRDADVFETGTGLSGSICYFGVKGQVNDHPDLWDGVGLANKQLVPIKSTLKPGLKDIRGNHNVATVLCDLKLSDGTLDPTSPRQVALQQLARLKDELGLSIWSSFEAEFGVTDSETKKPLGNNFNNWTSLVVMERAQETLLDLTNAMEEIGIKIDTLQSECGIGQFEITFAPTLGIEAADMAAGFKTSAYVYLQQKGYNAEFMTCVNPHDGCRNGFHYNFSLWTEEGKNAFLDPDAPNNLSELGRHWLAGLVEHAPGMLALNAPTINCYRRVGTPWAPTWANWGPDDRLASYRLKREAGHNVYVESRLPSSACSPHLILASLLAAGLDGVRRKLELPEPGGQARRLPATLEGALQALDEDAPLKQALGEKMVEFFVYTKRTYEVEEFKAFQSLSDQEMLEKEKEYYYLPY